MALKEVKNAKFPCFTSEQVRHRNQSLGFDSKTAKLGLDESPFDIDLWLCSEPVSFRHEATRLMLTLTSAESDQVCVVVELSTLNVLFEKCTFPQVVTGASQDFLSLLMHLFVSSVLEKVLVTRLSLNQVRLINSGEHLELSNEFVSIQLVADQRPLMILLISGYPVGKIFDPKPMVTDVVNIELPSLVAVGYVHLEPDDFALIEPGDFLRVTLLSDSSCFFLGDSCQVKVAADSDVTLDDVQTHNLVTKSVMVSIHQVLGNHTSISSALRAENQLVIKFENHSFRGRVVKIKENFYFLVGELLTCS